MSRLAKCMTCDGLAVWELAPADSYGEYCDDCVPRGCSCNLIDLSNPRARKQRRDGRGRLLPCCEYEYLPDGFEPSPPDKVARWSAHRAAQVIEARRAATGTGAVEDESAVGNADAPNLPPENPNDP